MTLYRYRAITQDGALEKRQIDLPSPQALKNHLRERGDSLISYSREFRLFPQRKLKVRVLREICLHLMQFEAAKIPLKDSLEDLQSSHSDKNLTRLLRAILRDVEGGLLLSQALEKHPSIFDEIFVGLVQAGEKLGNLSGVFEQISNHLKWKEDVQNLLIKNLRYPLLMALVLFLSLGILMVTLVPELAVFIQNQGQDLPFATRALIAFSGFLRTHIVLVCLALGGPLSLLALFFRLHPKGGFWKRQLIEILPFYGALKRQLSLIQFCHVFSLLFEGNRDALQSLAIVERAMSSIRIQDAVLQAKNSLAEGVLLSAAFERTGAFPPLIIRLIKMGEQTNTLPSSLRQGKELLNTSLQREVDHLIGLIEPTMILGGGALLAWIVGSLFLPLYESFSQVGY